MSVSHDAYDVSYQPPRKAVLLLTCMDLRLMDDVVQFMDHDNLTNRYDHVTIAGCALGVLGANGQHANWEKTFREHFEIAHRLRKFEDVYIIEHRHCGAYEAFLGADGTFGESDLDQQREADTHAKYAHGAAEMMVRWGHELLKLKDPLRVRTFLMDLRGHVDQLPPPPPPTGGRRKK